MPELTPKAKTNEQFRHFAGTVSRLVGSTWTFILAILFIAVWWIAHALGNFPERDLVWVSTVCTVMTFLIVFLIQNTQNRHNRAMQLKLDELIKSQQKASNELVGLEDFTDEELDAVQDEFQSLREEVISRHRARRSAPK